MKYYAQITSRNELANIDTAIMSKDEYNSEDVLNIEVTEEIYNNAVTYGSNYYVYSNGNIILNPNYQQEQAEKERQRLDALTLTPADVERALYRAKGMDFEDLKALIAQQIPQVDIKGLSIEFRAKDFYRGAMAVLQDDKTNDDKTISSLQNDANSESGNNDTNLTTQRLNDLTSGIRLFDVVGALLGYTTDDMDYLFEHKELPNESK